MKKTIKGIKKYIKNSGDVTKNIFAIVILFVVMYGLLYVDIVDVPSGSDGMVGSIGRRIESGDTGLLGTLSDKMGTQTVETEEPETSYGVDNFMCYVINDQNMTNYTIGDTTCFNETDDTCTCIKEI